MSITNCRASVYRAVPLPLVIARIQVNEPLRTCVCVFLSCGVFRVSLVVRLMEGDGGEGYSSPSRSCRTGER